MGGLGWERWPWAAPGKACGSILQPLTLSALLSELLVSVYSLGLLYSQTPGVLETLSSVLGDTDG